MFEYDYLPVGAEISVIRKELQELADFISAKERLDRTRVLMVDSTDGACVCVLVHDIYIPIQECVYGRAYVYAVLIHEIAHLVVQRAWEIVDGWRPWKAHGDEFKSCERRMLASFGISVSYDSKGELWASVEYTFDGKNAMMGMARDQYVQGRVVLTQDILKFHATGQAVYFDESEAKAVPVKIIWR